MDLKFSVDKERCIGCEACVKECIFDIPVMSDGFPILNREQEGECIGCQHCMAVCPTGALSVMGLNPDTAINLSAGMPTAEQMALLIKGRRSVRQYHNRALPGETLSFLLETALYAPTAVNNSQVMFTVVEDLGTMDAIRHAAYDALRAKMANGGLGPGMEYLEERMAQSKGDEADVIFRNAPHMLVASAPREEMVPEVDCLIALSYFELLAASKGVGALWCGLAKVVLTQMVPHILAELGVPDSHTVGYVLVFGEPDVRFQRAVQKDTRGRINRVSL